MKRNWDTVRDLLTRLEDEEFTDQPLRLACFQNSPERDSISYHMELLIEAGLVQGYMSKELGSWPADFVAERLTWSGHEFLDAIRNDTLWNKTKAKFASEGLGMTMELVKTFALSTATKMLSLP
ncbi:DUF2513 domain-containing protein [Aeromonas rivipollensis]|uniref:DUF2513 domain-containing protein n=1 Tax=Aeromonas rivipollensis TaxID=948519 RepID=UPI0038D03E31